MKAQRRRSILMVLLLAASVAPLQAVEIDTGRLRLILHEGIGRFSLYTRPTATSPDYVPLFVDRDPRTSGISLVVNDRIYKLGDSSEFSESAVTSTEAGTARFRWTSRTLEVSQEFTPVRSSSYAQVDGVRMVIRISNRSRSRLSVGLKFLLDTYLGEEKLSHFSTDRHQEIRNELTVTGSDMIRYWLSSSGSPGGATLACVTSGYDITPPDKIVFANWKRLSDASWDYKTSSARNFNLMPYSINDSAVCMYYNPVELAEQESREIVLVLGGANVINYTGPAQAAAATPSEAPAPEVTQEAVPEESQEVIPEEVPEETKEEVPEEVQEAVPVQRPEAAPTGGLQGIHDRLSSETGSVQQDLAELNYFIHILDERLAAGEPISEEELRLMEEILSAIKDRSERYSGGR